jgi:hypothetical protein
MQVDSTSFAGIQARSLLQQSSASDVESLSASSAHDKPEIAAKKFESWGGPAHVAVWGRARGAGVLGGGPPAGRYTGGGDPDGFFGEGPQADVYSGWLDQYLGEALARDGGLHLADGLKRSLEQKQAALDAQENAAGAQPALKSGAQPPMTTEGELGTRGDAAPEPVELAPPTGVAERVATALVTQKESR